MVLAGAFTHARSHASCRRAYLPFHVAREAKGWVFPLAKGLEVESQLTVPVANSPAGLQATTFLNKAMGHGQEANPSAWQPG